MASLRKKQYCVFGCIDLGAYMHGFPHPERRTDMFKMWVSIVGNKLKETNPWKVFKNKKICAHHFTSDQKVASHRLKINAFPSINLNGIFLTPGIEAHMEHNYCLPSSADIESTSSMLQPLMTNIDEGGSPVSAPAASPLLTSLQKSSPVITTPQHISHPANFVACKMWDLKACRCCLLISEAGLIRLTENHKKSYNMLTGLEIKAGDGLPTYICMECSTYLKKAMQFRRKTRRAHFVLQNIMATKKQVMLRDIKLVNRKSCTLESALSFTSYELANLPAEDTKSFVNLGNINIVFRTSDQMNMHPNSNSNSNTSNVASSSSADAIGSSDVATGLSNVATGSSNVAIGSSNVASGSSNVDIGSSNVASCSSNIASGSSNVATGSRSVASGSSNVARGKLTKVYSAKPRNVANDVSSNVVSDYNDSEISEVQSNITLDNMGNTIDTDMVDIAAGDDTNVFNDNTVIDDEPAQVNDEDIDLEDVFKGLKEDDDYCVESESEVTPTPMPPPPQKNKKEKKNLFVSGLIDKSNDPQKNQCDKWLMYNTSDKKYVIKREYIDAIVNSEVTYLTPSQQTEVFKRRLQSEHFVKATYKCAICIKVFEDFDLLKYHVKIHNEGINYKYRCDICKIQCDSQDKMLVHSANTHWYTYTCKSCGQVKYTVQELNQCYKKHNPTNSKGIKILELDLDTLFTKIALQPHEYEKTMHLYSGTPSPHSCDKCRIYFTRAIGLDNHQLLHEVPSKNVPYYTCDICNIHFPNHISRLEKHMSAWHQYGYKCKWCSAYVYNKYQAKHHMLCHQNISCNLCDNKKKYINQNGLIRHQSVVHASQFYKEFCNLCGSAYNTLLALYNHQFSAHGYLSRNNPEIGNPDYRCNHCDVSFIDKQCLYKHITLLRHKHVDNVEHICQTCFEAFDTSDEKISHQCKWRRYPARCKKCSDLLYDYLDEVNHNATHHPDANTQESQITSNNQNLMKMTSQLCDLCGMLVKRTGWSRHLRFHRKFPNGLFSCVYCGMKLYTARYYFGHILWHHTRNPYMCRACPARFDDKWKCKDHILRVHAPEKPYSCDFCKREFSHLSYLSEHTKRMHGAKSTTAKYQTKPFCDKINIYPLMKIDATHVPFQLIEHVELVKSDYLDQHLGLIKNYHDYLVFDSTESPIIKAKTAKEDSKPKKRKLDEKPEVVSKKKKGGMVQSECLETETKIAIDSITPKEEQANSYMKTEVVSNKLGEANADSYEEYVQEEFLEDFYKSEETVDYDGLEDNLKEEYSVESENIETSENQEDGTNINIEDLQEQIAKGNYDIIEHEGERCILVDGVVFKIETD